MMTTKKKILCLGAILLVLPLILVAESCNTTKIGLRINNDTGGCSGGPCTIMVKYNWVSGGGTEAPFGPRSLTLNVNPGLSPQVDYVEGVSNFQTISTCHNLQGSVEFGPGNWIHRFFCGTGADGKTQVLQHELIPDQE